MNVHRSQERWRGAARTGLLVLCFACICGFAYADQPETGSEGDAASQAQEERDRARARAAFQRGHAAWQEERYEEAIGHWEIANAILPNPVLHLYIGQAHAHLGAWQRALVAYREHVDSVDTPDPAVLVEIERLEGEAVAEALHTSRQALAASLARALGEQPPPASMRRFEAGTVMRDVPVQIVSNPPGARIYIDDVALGAVGTTPMETRLFTGRHRILVEREHYRPAQQTLQVAPLERGESIPVLRFVLEPEELDVQVSARPASATITWVADSGERSALGIGAWEGTLPAGPGTFVLQDGARDRRIETVLRPPDEGEGPLQIVLHVDPRDEAMPERRLGTLTVESSLLRGDLLLNGQHIGEAPGTFVEQVRPGRHRVEVRSPGYSRWEREVEVTEGEQVRLHTPSELSALRLPSPVPGIVLAGIGVAAAGTGVALMAVSDPDDTLGDVGLYSVIGGATLVGAGVLWSVMAATTRSRNSRLADAPPVQWHALPLPGGGAASLRVTWP